MKFLSSFFVFFSTILFLTFAGCKESELYWQPDGQFNLLKEDGTPAPAGTEFFSLETVSNDTEILVLNFFAPKCKPCIDELPELKKIHRTILEKDHIEFVAIGSVLTAMGEGAAQDLDKIATEVFDFMKEHSLKYASYLATTDLLENFGVTGFPETFILYRDKKRNWYVKRRYISSITEENIYPYLNM